MARSIATCGTADGGARVATSPTRAPVAVPPANSPTKYHTRLETLRPGESIIQIEFRVQVAPEVASDAIAPNPSHDIQGCWAIRPTADNAMPKIVGNVARDLR